MWGIRKGLAFALVFAAFVPIAIAADETKEQPLTKDQLEEIASSKYRTHYEAVDAMLADSMIDPTSPIQYEVTGLLLCKSLGKVATSIAGDDNCACYYINTKNTFGAYTGKRLGIMAIIPAGKGFFALDISEHAANSSNELLCTKASFRKRDSSFIRAAAGVE